MMAQKNIKITTFCHSRNPCEAHIVSEDRNPHIPSLRAQRGNLEK
jgi:hypothetical protein